MAIAMEAVYEDGVLKPVRPLPLEERERVQITNRIGSWLGPAHRGHGQMDG
jgi:predicted DNA-binding antitoxin AbrB/MazE fold protein